jgi:phosphodiesterase/alkaline phosphatase D-like protein
MAGLKIARTYAAALGAVALAALLAGAVAQAPTGGFYIAPYVQNASPDGITVMWETPEPMASVVEYGPAAGSGYAQKATDAKQVKIHKVRITGLKPDAAYRYRVRADGATHEAVFRTAPARVSPRASPCSATPASGRPNGRPVASRST